VLQTKPPRLTEGYAAWFLFLLLLKLLLQPLAQKY